MLGGNLPASSGSGRLPSCGPGLGSRLSLKGAEGLISHGQSSATTHTQTGRIGLGSRFTLIMSPGTVESGSGKGGSGNVGTGSMERWRLVLSSNGPPGAKGL
jgi:hypothetical protein